MSTPKRDIEQIAPWIVDRRVFVGTLAAASAVTLLPLPADAASVLPGAAALAPSRGTGLLADWHIDDQWGPRYAEPIAHCRPASDAAVAESDHNA
jgi:hypothetical protein